MPMGPITLADTVGLDICLSVAEILAQSTAFDIPERLRQLVAAGHVGRKAGRGFYLYQKGRPIKPSASKKYSTPADLSDRLMLRMLNEAVACLHEQVVDNADHLDAGVIFGTGFAPFRGGPIHYINWTGAAQLMETLHALEQRHGDRFRAHAGWTQLVQTSA
jgi:3-hydroxyacyl-CoA dehydrogenase / enoyl-CoA hydratase / 3-hydroxybutyryl-CoA epimerase